VRVCWRVWAGSCAKHVYKMRAFASGQDDACYFGELVRSGCQFQMAFNHSLSHISACIVAACCYAD
jgi:hypothetical protein